MSLLEGKIIFLANICFSILLAISAGAFAGCNRGKFACPVDKQFEFPLPFADPNDCHFFHVCHTLDKVYLDRCGPESHFDGRKCVPGWCPNALPGCQPLQSPENLSSLSIGPPVTGNFDCLGKTGDGNPDEFPDPNDCEYFFICYSEKRIVRLSCGEGQHFEGDLCVPGKCPSKIPGAKPLIPKYNNCGMEEFECPNAKLGKYADPNDCSFYFVCFNLNIIARSRCEAGHHFNGQNCIPGECPTPVKDTCEENFAIAQLFPPYITTTAIQTTPTTPTTPEPTTTTTETPEPTTTTTETPTTTTTTTETPETTTTTTTTPPPPPTTTPAPCYVDRFHCNLYKLGAHPDPANCRYYIKCIYVLFAIIQKTVDCGTGYHFEGGYCRAGPCPKICKYR